MPEFYDVTKSLLLAKAREGTLAFAGFTAVATDTMPARDGVLKVAAFTRSDGSGYLTLTFVLDLNPGPESHAAIRERFSRAGQEVLATRLGPDFEMLLDVPLDAFAAAAPFHLEELNLYFRRLAGRERPLLAGQVLPALAVLLGFAFEPLEWLTEVPEATPRET